MLDVSVDNWTDVSATIDGWTVDKGCSGTSCANCTKNYQTFVARTDEAKNYKTILVRYLMHLIILPNLLFQIKSS